MDTPSQKWFVERFHLHSPVDEFQSFAQAEVGRLRAENPAFDNTSHREAVDLVLAKLRPARPEVRS